MARPNEAEAGDTSCTSLDDICRGQRDETLESSAGNSTHFLRGILNVDKDGHSSWSGFIGADAGAAWIDWFADDFSAIGPY